MLKKILFCVSLFVSTLITPVFASTIVGGVISQDTTWTLAGSPYIVTSDVTVQYPNFTSGTATLTIQPGVEVQFAPGKKLIIGNCEFACRYAALNAQGTPSQPIVFTSGNTTKAPGDWNGIYFSPANNGLLSILDHVRVEYAGGGGINAITITGTSFQPMTITNSAIENNANTGIHITDSSPFINYNTINNNNAYPISVNSNGYLLNLGAFNSASSNGLGDKIELRGGEISTDTVWPNVTLPYLVTSDITVQHPNFTSGTVTLTIQPGVEVQFAPGRRLIIGTCDFACKYAALNAQGTPSQPIVFTSGNTTKAPGDWNGIYFSPANNGLLSVLNNIRVEYAGGGGNNGITINGSSFQPMTVTNSVIQRNLNNGISVTNSSPSITSNLISENTNHGLYLYNFNSAVMNSVIQNNGSNGIYVENSIPIVRNNLVQGNTGYGINLVNTSVNLQHNNIFSNVQSGINNTGTNTVSAEYNWWGDASGPSGIGSGSGQLLNGNINYEPWSGELVNGDFYFSNGTVSLKQFNQNGDTTILHAEMTENTDWQIVVKDSSSTTVRNFSGTGNSITQSWVGDDNSNQPLANGTYTYIISAASIAHPGKTASIVGQLILDDSLLLSILSNISISQRLFKPRIHTTTAVQYTLTVDATVTVKIFDFTTNNLVRMLVNGQLREAGDYAEDWDGANDSAQMLPEGAYYFTIDAENANHEFGRYAPVLSTAPVLMSNLSVTPSSNFSAIKGDRMAFSYDLTAPAKVTLGNSQNNLTFIVDKPSVATGNIAYWDGRGPQGEIVTGGAWVEAEMQRYPENYIVIADDRTIDIDVLKTDPYLIRPVYNEITTVSYNITESADVTVKILNQAGNQIISVLQQSVPQTAGTHSVIWNGKTTAGDTVITPGDYRVRVEALDAYGKTTIRDGNIRVVY